MIVLTVKTLDSQNHTFTVDDDITVEDFKTKIADTVNIPAETQRIIYCGRVLQDNAKLSEYDVNGKVVHLVQRAPPSQNPPTTRSASPQPPRRGFRGFETENTMYLGSMAFPSNLMESQGIVPPPPTHSLAGSRLNVARRMLRRADAVISLLENPSARPSEQANTEEQPEEEVTPIIEARVIVPPGNNETIDEAMVLSAVQNTLFDAASGSIPMAAEVTVDGNAGASAQNSETPPGERSASSTPEEGAAANDAGEGSSTGDQRTAGVSARTLAENACRTSEMAELLATLNQLQTRFQPFLERYRHFMVEDPIIPQENVRQTQAMLTRVSEVLHFLGHAYHSLSDIIIRVRTPPPRPLLCRPILIQHSAVVQAGIPIQVEVAQFNLSTERPNASTTSGTPTTTTDTTTTSAPSSGDTTRPTNAGAGGAPPTMNFRGFPFIPAASMRVQSFPIEVRTTARPVNVVQGTRGMQNNNNNTVGATTENRAPQFLTSTPRSSVSTPPSATSTNSSFNFNNSSVEFFMEVTPEVLQGTLNGPPPEFLQSLVQMAGQIMNRITTTSSTSDTNTTTTTSAPTSADSSQASSTHAPQQTTTTQSTQARGNTQTNPTTATHTRSTPRPHVHLAQQAMQGGFDPFLPCNSHHVTQRRRGQQSTGTSTTRQQARPQGQEGEEGGEQRDRPRPQNLDSLFDEIYSSLRTAYRRRREVNATQAGAQGSQAPPGGANEEAGQSNAGARQEGGVGGGAATGQVPPALAGLLPNLQIILDNLPLQGPTIADILQQLPLDESQENPGESIITDLIMLLSRNLTIVDMITLNTGNFEPLSRVTNEIRNFVRTRVLDGSDTPEALNTGVDRLINEMQPFFQNFSRLRVRDNIDLVRSVEALFRKRLPEVVVTATTLGPHTMETLVDQCLLLAKLMCTLALHASANGQPGVEETFQQIITSYMQGIPPGLQDWTRMTSGANLQHFMANIGINPADVEQYIVRNRDVPMAASSEPTVQSEVRTAPPQESEPMDLDEPLATTNTTQPDLPPLSVGDESEPLPNIVLGAEPWHGQVPEDWVPIITRDVHRQRRQNPQAPFSDAYLSGMPTKRRKIVNSTKPQGSLPQVIAESVRRAVTTTGLASVAPLEAVAQGAGDSADVQSAYRSLLRTTVQTALRDNTEFTPERYPNASTYFKTQ